MKRQSQTQKKGAPANKPTPFRRAVWDDDKLLRRQSLLDSASQLFAKKDFENISVQDICAGAGVAKGTFYLYFATKEAAYLVLEGEEISAWLDDVEARVQKIPNDLGSSQLCELFVSSIEVRPFFPRYLSILHHVLEKNVSEEQIVEFKFFLKDRLGRTADLLASCIKGFSRDIGMQTLIFIHTCIVGGWQMANPAPLMKKVLEREDMAEFRLDFSHVLRTFLASYLRGVMER